MKLEAIEMLRNELLFYVVKIYGVFGKNPKNRLVQFNPHWLGHPLFRKLKTEEICSYYRLTYWTRGQVRLNARVGLIRIWAIRLRRRFKIY